MIELALVVVILGCFVGAVVWLMNWSGKAGQNREIVDQQKRDIQELQEVNENARRREDLERSIPVDGASERLRKGPFVRD